MSGEGVSIDPMRSALSIETDLAGALGRNTSSGAVHSSDIAQGSDAFETQCDDPPVSLSRLKRVARELPEGDPVRQLIEGEPDALPIRVLAAKADSWVLLLLRRED